MANAIIRLTRGHNPMPHFKYNGYLVIDLSNIQNNKQNIGHHVLPTFRRIIMANNKLRQFYVNHNIYNYLDTSWNGGKYRTKDIILNKIKLIIISLK